MKKVILLLTLMIVICSGCSVGGYTIIKDNELKNLKDQADKLNFEKEKWQKEQEDKQVKVEEEKNKEISNEINQEACLENVSTVYTDSWNSSCALWKSDVDLAWKRCRQNKFSYQTDEENKQFCITAAPDYKEDANGMCLLPKTKSNIIETRAKEMKDDCYLKYPSN